jgi:phosphoribosylformimino-5-aminoimidazole carboxamide ribotide isomerase
VIVFAAVDLQQGEVVQLVGGAADSARVRLADPVAVACSWVSAGFAALHVVDLDAALGTGSNLPAIENIIRAVDVPVQVGGGLRDDAALARVFGAGAERAIVGTRAIEDPQWRNRIADAHPGRIVVAADARAGRIVTRGWTMDTARPIVDLLCELNDVPLAAVLVTDVSREGRLAGIDADLFRSVCTDSHHPVFAAGGVAGNADVALLAELGAAGVVLGMALYTGAIDVTSLPGARV